MSHLYFDNNATTPLDPAVAAAMREVELVVGNPASAHRFGRRARQLVEDAREAIGLLVGADVTSVRPDRLLFTSGGTEANNLAIYGLASARGPGELIVSAVEHPSVIAAAKALESTGAYRLLTLGVDSDGVARVEQLAELITPATRLVCLMLGNNETGVVQPVAVAARSCQARGVPLHVDAVQVAGKQAIDFANLGATTLTLTAHKLHGPPGIGALVVRQGTDLHPQLHGGVQQFGLRPGTESVALAVGFRHALETWATVRLRETARLAALRDRFEMRLSSECGDIESVGHRAVRLPHVSNVAFLGVEREALFVALDMAGIACSTGSACASGSTDPSPVLLAMGCPRAVVQSALRFSFGRFTTAEQIDDGVQRIARVVEELRSGGRR